MRLMKPLLASVYALQSPTGVQPQPKPECRIGNTGLLRDPTKHFDVQRLLPVSIGLFGGAGFNLFGGGTSKMLSRVVVISILSNGLPVVASKLNEPTCLDREPNENMNRNSKFNPTITFKQEDIVVINDYIKNITKSSSDHCYGLVKFFLKSMGNTQQNMRKIIEQHFSNETIAFAQEVLKETNSQYQYDPNKFYQLVSMGNMSLILKATKNGQYFILWTPNHAVGVFRINNNQYVIFDINFLFILKPVTFPIALQVLNAIFSEVDIFAESLKGYVFVESNDQFIEAISVKNEITTYFFSYIGHVEKVNQLLAYQKKHVKSSYYNEYMSRALYMASQNNHSGVVKALLREDFVGDKITAYNNMTALYVATTHGHSNVVQLLVNDSRIDVNYAVDGDTALLMSIYLEHGDVIQKLLNCSRVNVNQALPDGWTPLLLSVSKGYGDGVRMLVNCSRIDINQALPNGWTPLLLSVDRFSRAKSAGDKVEMGVYERIAGRLLKANASIDDAFKLAKANKIPITTDMRRAIDSFKANLTCMV